MVEDYLKALGKMFSYGYGCYVFKHGIRGDRPRIQDDMPDFVDPLSLEFFFSNLGCPFDLSTCRGKGCGGSFGRSGKRPYGGHRHRGVGLTLSLISVFGFFYFFGDFCKVRCFATRIHTIPCNPWRLLAHCTRSYFNEKTFS